MLGRARDAAGCGIAMNDVRLDLPAAHKHKADVVRRSARGVEYLMKKNGVTVLQGHGRLRGAGKVEVTPAQGAPQVVTTRNVILATGSVPKLLPGLKIDGSRVLTSTEALALEFVPKTFLILGAGAVGVEFASMYQSFGSSVTLVEMLPRVLPLEDEEISAELSKALKKRGINVRVGTKVEEVRVTDKGVEVRVQTDKGAKEELKAEVLLVAVGRKPVTEGIGLEGTRVELDRGFVKV